VTVDAPRSSPFTIDALKIRKRLGRDKFLAPLPYGDGWKFDGPDPRDFTRIIVSPWIEPGGVEWVHASISHSHGVMPTYGDLKILHQAVFEPGYSYQVFVPPAEHINITANVLHLWGRLDGAPALPNFGRFGTI
jgi:hypothetical protein